MACLFSKVHSKTQFWSILGRAVKPVVSDPFIIGLFSGDKNPGKVGEYLQDCIAEVQFINPLELTHLFYSVPDSRHSFDPDSD